MIIHLRAASGSFTSLTPSLVRRDKASSICTGRVTDSWQRHPTQSGELYIVYFTTNLAGRPRLGRLAAAHTNQSTISNFTPSICHHGVAASPRKRQSRRRAASQGAIYDLQSKSYDLATRLGDDLPLFSLPDDHLHFVVTPYGSPSEKGQPTCPVSNDMNTNKATS
jgi:hypothetical protein